MHHDMRRVVKFFLFIPIFVVFFALIGWGVMALWNGVMPGIFSVRTVSYTQALGLLALSWILFGGLRGRGSSHGLWERGMRKRWQRMTPAERDEFLKGLRSRWGGEPAPESEPKA